MIVNTSGFKNSGRAINITIDKDPATLSDVADKIGVSVSSCSWSVDGAAGNASTPVTDGCKVKYVPRNIKGA